MIRIEELSAKRWRDFEKLFGERGACGGCWCQAWRVERGEKWDEIKGAPAKRRMKSLVAKGRAHGLIAYDGDEPPYEPIGWCAFDKRTDFARLDRAPSLACDDAERVWSLPCFFIRRDHRGRGVAGKLLAHAVKVLKRRGAKIIEGYPANPRKPGKIPDAFAWCGTPSLFRKAGFFVAGNHQGGKLRVRLEMK